MIASIASQEAIERLVEKMIGARAVHQQNPRPPRVRMAPSDHYSIAKYARATDDLTAWLSERPDNLIFEVPLFVDVFKYSFTNFLRISFHDSKTICLLDIVVSHMTEMNTISPMLIAPQSCSPTTNYITIVFCV